MDAILNNPYRILGLEPTNDESIINERVSKILALLNIGEKVSLPIDEFYNTILVDPYNTQYYNCLATNKGEPIPARHIETVKIANEKLQDPIKRKYYALFAFEFDKTYRGLDIDELIKALEIELEIEEKRINKFGHTDLHDFLNYYREEDTSNYIIEKDYNSLNINNLTDFGSFLKPFKTGLKISQDSIFSLDFECNWIEGVDNSSFSFFWGKDPSKSSYYSFGISGNGYFYLSNSEDGQRLENDLDFIGWKKSDIIEQHGKNHIEIRRNIDCIEFYINGIFIHKSNTFREFYGEDFGFIVFGKQVVEFSNFKINYYYRDIDFASNIVISSNNFRNIQKLSLFYFFKAFTYKNIRLAKSEITTNQIDDDYQILSKHIYLDKALILLGKYFQKEVLLNSAFFDSDSHFMDEYNFISQFFLEDLIYGLKESLQNGRTYFWLSERLAAYPTEFIENLFIFSKNYLLQLPDNNIDNPIYSIDVRLFEKSKIHKTQFLSALNNPFRVLSLKYNSTEKEISKQVSDLLIYAGMGKPPRYNTDLFFGEVDRSIENIKDAAKKLDNPNRKLYYSMFWFIEENAADRNFLKEMMNLNNFEDVDELRRLLIHRAVTNFLSITNIDFDGNEINYNNSIKTICGEKYKDAHSKLNNFIDTTLSTEESQFCLYDDITSLLPLDINSYYTNNQLIIKSEADNEVLLFKNIYIDHKVAYEIEFDCEWIEGEEENKLYSLVFCKDQGNNFYRFGLTANGNLYFDAIIGGIEQKIGGWNLDKNINLKAKNHLHIIIGSPTIFYLRVNGKPIDKSDSLSSVIVIDGDKWLFGNYIGVSVEGKQKVAFSNLKITYTNHTSKKTTTSKIKSSNITSAINLVTLNLCHCSFVEEQFFYLIDNSIAIFSKILSSEYFPEFSSKIIGNHANVDLSVLEKYFIDDIYNFVKPHFNKYEINEFIESFHLFTDASQNYIVHKFIGRPILDIEDSILKTKDFLKNTPLHGLTLGSNLFNSTNEKLITVRRILFYTNYQYRLLANSLADTLLDCGIIYFNTIIKNRDVLLSEGDQILELVNHANTIAIDGNTRKRVNDNIVFFEKWVSDAQKKEQEKFRQELEKQKKLRKEQETKEQEQKRQNQEREKNRQEQETLRQEQYKQEQERERLRKGQESTKSKSKTNINQTIYITTNKPNIGKQIFQKLKKIEPVYFLYGLIFIIILIVILAPDKKQHLASSNKIYRDPQPIKSNFENNAPTKSQPDLNIDLSHYKPRNQQTELIQESKWKGNKLNNGDSPYNGYFGKGIYDYNSDCYLIFKNGYSTDAIVCLENTTSGRTIRNEYIQAGTNYKMTNIPEGIYKVKTFSGNNWNQEKTLNNGEINGAFDTDLSFSTSDNPSDLIQMRITETGDGIRYSTGEITLYTVSHGNMQQRNINSDEFFK